MQGSVHNFSSLAPCAQNDGLMMSSILSCSTGIVVLNPAARAVILSQDADDMWHLRLASVSNPWYRISGLKSRENSSAFCLLWYLTILYSSDDKMYFEWSAAMK